MVCWPFPCTRTIIMKVPLFLLVSFFLGNSGCNRTNSSFTWRTDTAPMVKRMPILMNCTNMLWHGELITKNSFFSPPGPSAYRVVCFVPNASGTATTVFGGKLDLKPMTETDLFYPEEKRVLKSQHGIDVDHDRPMTSVTLNEAFIRHPYWGQCVYFKQSDVVCIFMFGE